MAFELPKLPYELGALAPVIDKQTMEFHYGKHHQGYVNNLNKLMADSTVKEVSLDKIIKNISSYSSGIRNNAGGHYNHSMFWKIMSPSGGGEPTGAIASAINNSFLKLTSITGHPVYSLAP